MDIPSPDSSLSPSERIRLERERLQAQLRILEEQEKREKEKESKLRELEDAAELAKRLGKEASSVKSLGSSVDDMFMKFLNHFQESVEYLKEERNRAVDEIKRLQQDLQTERKKRDEEWENREEEIKKLHNVVVESLKKKMERVEEEKDFLKKKIQEMSSGVIPLEDPVSSVVRPPKGKEQVDGASAPNQKDPVAMSDDIPCPECQEVVKEEMLERHFKMKHPEFGIAVSEPHNPNTVTTVHSPMPQRVPTPTPSAPTPSAPMPSAPMSWPVQDSPSLKPAGEGIDIFVTTHGASAQQKLRYNMDPTDVVKSLKQYISQDLRPPTDVESIQLICGGRYLTDETVAVKSLMVAGLDRITMMAHRRAGR